jgi:hypothetical protein
MMADVSFSDKAVLLKLYEATNGENWQQNGICPPVATWYGITLDQDKVAAISLADNNLMEEILVPTNPCKSTRIKFRLHKNGYRVLISFIK